MYNSQRGVDEKRISISQLDTELSWVYPKLEIITQLQ